MYKGTYTIRNAKNSGEWDDLFGKVEKPHLTQAYPYGEAKKITEAWHVNRLVFEKSGDPIAICQVLEKRTLGLRAVSRVNRGPLFIGPLPDQETVLNTYALLRRKWQHFVGGVLIFAPALENTDENRALLAAAGFRQLSKVGWSSLRLDLQKSEEDLRKNLAAAWRNRLKHSECSGLMLNISNSIDKVDWMLERHVENMKTKGFTRPHVPLVRSIFESSPEDFLVFQANFEGEPVGAMMITRFCHLSEFYIGWIGEAGRNMNAGNFLYWNVTLEMKNRGSRWLDLGGSGPRDKFGQFKRGMRGDEYKLCGEWLSF